MPWCGASRSKGDNTGRPMAWPERLWGSLRATALTTETCWGAAIMDSRGRWEMKSESQNWLTAARTQMLFICRSCQKVLTQTGGSRSAYTHMGHKKLMCHLYRSLFFVVFFHFVNIKKQSKPFSSVHDGVPACWNGSSLCILSPHSPYNSPFSRCFMFKKKGAAYFEAMV